MPRPVSVPEGRVSATTFRLFGSQTLREQLLTVCKKYSPMGPQAHTLLHLGCSKALRTDICIIRHGQTQKKHDASDWFCELTDCGFRIKVMDLSNNCQYVPAPKHKILALLPC